MDTAIAIGQGLGLAVACALVALLPLAVGALAALAGALPGALGAYDDTAVVAASGAAGLANAGLGPVLPDAIRLPLAAAGGAAAFELAAGDALPWVGLAIGAAAGVAAGWVGRRVVDGARRADGSAGGVAVIAASATLGLAALALIPFLGYLFAPAVAYLAIRIRRQKDAKHAGLTGAIVDSLGEYFGI